MSKLKKLDENDFLNFLTKIINKKNKKKYNLKLITTFSEIEIDSFDLIEIILELEKKYNIKFKEEDLFNLKKINDLFLLINQMIEKK
jgi:acyl carrier protein